MRMVMAYKVKNTALDHSRRLSHRQAAKMQMEPVIGGQRLRLRSHIILTDPVFEQNKPNLELYKKWGVLDWEHIGGAKPVEVKKPIVAKKPEKVEAPKKKEPELPPAPVVAAPPAPEPPKSEEPPSAPPAPIVPETPPEPPEVIAPPAPAVLEEKHEEKKAEDKKEEAPLAETPAPVVETEPQPKSSPFKGKKKQS